MWVEQCQLKYKIIGQNIRRFYTVNASFDHVYTSSGYKRKTHFNLMLKLNVISGFTNVMR